LSQFFSQFHLIKFNFVQKCTKMYKNVFKCELQYTKPLHLLIQMNLKEVLNLADRIVFEKTGQHLDDLQEAVLRGTLQRETYKHIAKDFDCSESSVRKVGAELWEILSEELGEDVSKRNLRSAMGRFIFENVSNFENVAISRFNICGEARYPPDIPNLHPPNQEISNSKPTKTLHQDLSEMPELGDFYDRTLNSKPSQPGFYNKTAASSPSPVSAAPAKHP